MHKLLPFPSHKIPDLDISVSVFLKSKIDETNPLITNTQIIMEFYILGNIEDVLIPTTKLGKVDNLWEHTCFEMFLHNAEVDNSSYIEINSAPQNSWNSYVFTSYRNLSANFGVENFVKNVNYETLEHSSAIYHNKVTISVDEKHFLFESPHNVRVSITAVIDTIKMKNALTDTLSYWSIKHCGAIPDFHLREGFILPIIPYDSYCADD